MKIFNIPVDLATYNQLKDGELGLDVRLDIKPYHTHEIGDIVIYQLKDAQGELVEGANIAFLITTKVHLDSFVTRMGEQMLRHAPYSDSDIVIITLSPTHR